MGWQCLHLVSACVCVWTPLWKQWRSSGWRGVCMCASESLCARVSACLSPVIPSPDLEVTTSQAQSLGTRCTVGTWLQSSRRFFPTFPPSFFSNSSSPLFFFKSFLEEDTPADLWKTHVDLCDQSKPEGMPIFFVQLTLLLSLIARARGEWLAAILQEEQCDFFVKKHS